MRRLAILLVAVLAAAFAAALIARAGSSGGPAFRTPDAGAACRLAGTALVCSSLGSEGSIELGGTGRARVVHRLPWWDASTPVLHRWHHGAITCSLKGNSILCRSGATAIRVTAGGFAVAS